MSGGFEIRSFYKRIKISSVILFYCGFYVILNKHLFPKQKMRIVNIYLQKEAILLRVENFLKKSPCARGCS